jgi:hypothetical protein
VTGRLVLIGLGALCAAGCGTGASGVSDVLPSFTADPLEVVPTASGALTLAVRTSPQPATRGVGFAQFAITDTATGAPVDGLSVVVVPWMPAHGHGTTVQPTVVAQGGGIYEVDQVDFYMAGHWELRSTITAPQGQGDDTVVPTVDVQ